MFEVLEDKSTIKPTYPCGKVGNLVDAHRHGPRFAEWKLLDDLERHTGTKKKPECKTCVEHFLKNAEELELEKFFEEILEETRKARIQTNQMFEKLFSFNN